MAKLVFKGKEGGEFEPITPGIYEFQIIKADITQDKNGDPQMHCELEIAEGDLAGKKVPQWFGAEEKRGWAIRNLLDATNTPYDTLEEGDDNNAPTLEFDTDDLLQKYVRAELSHYKNVQKGKTYHNLGKFESSPLQAAAEGTPATETEEKPAEAPKTAPAAKPVPQTGVRRGAAPRTA